MSWKHVTSPSSGIITNDSPLVIDRKGSPFIKGCFVKNGEVVSDTGYINFPTPGALKTNALNGVFLGGYKYDKTDGTSYTIALTTTNAYQYNTTTATWDDITWGTNIDLCELAWTASANVTSTRDTSVKLHGTYSAKHVIAAAFTTGLASYYDTGAKDISDTTQHTYLMFWAYSTVTVAADTFRIRLSEQVAGGTGATYADYTVPALTANTWKHCIVAITSPVAASAGTFPDDLNAVLSVGLVVNSDPGAVTVYLDQIKAGRCFTGDADNIFSTCVYDNTFVITNGVDQPMKYTGTGTFSQLTTTLAAGSLTAAELVFPFKDHIVFANTVENGSTCKQRVTWGNIGELEELTGGTSGYQDLVDDESWIITAEPIGENEYILYKEKSIVKMSWVGGNTPFRFKTMISSVGIIGKRAIANKGREVGEHVVMGLDFIYSYTGGTGFNRIDEKISSSMYSIINSTYKERSFCIYSKMEDELQFWIPTSTEYPDDVWCISVTNGAWYRRNKAMTGFGYYTETSALTIADLSGVIGDQNFTFGSTLTKADTVVTLVGDSGGKIYKLFSGTYDNNGTAITNDFQTPDFSLTSGEDSKDSSFRVTQFIFEAKGTSVSTYWSDDSGESWHPTCGGSYYISSLGSTYLTYRQDFDTTVNKIRFRFYNTSASSGFYVRSYGFYYIVRSIRS